MKLLLVSAAVAAALAMGTPALAQPAGAKVGTLTCHEHSGWGFILGSSRRVSCVYADAAGTTRYVGRVSDAGVDVGYHGPSEIVWAVFAPTDRLGPGALNGHYDGVTAGGAVGVGVGANALVGGSDRTVSLQPISVAGNTGLDVAAGADALTLHHVPDFYQPA